MRSCTDNRNGFALLEAVIALAVIGLVVIALMAATAGQDRTAGKVTLLLTARSLADERLATLRMLDNRALLDLPDSLAGGSFDPPFGAYSWTMRVVQVGSERDLFSAVVTVQTADESYVLNTLLHEPPAVLQVGGLP